MVMVSRFLVIESVWGYRSPASHRHPGRKILPGREEVEILTSGFGDFEVEGRPQRLGAGSMLWYYPGERIHVTTPEVAPYGCVVFELRQHNQSRQQTNHGPPRLTTWEDPTEARRFAEAALGRFHPRMEGLALFSEYHIARMRWESAEFQRRRAMGAEALSPALDAALAYIEQHLHEPITIPAIAAAAGVGSAHLFSLFRKRFQESPMRRVIRLRMQRARDLLTTTALSIKEVGGAVGFENNVHFGRTFKALTGQTPAGYRRTFGRPTVPNKICPNAS